MTPLGEAGRCAGQVGGEAAEQSEQKDEGEAVKGVEAAATGEEEGARGVRAGGVRPELGIWGLGPWRRSLWRWARHWTHQYLPGTGGPRSVHLILPLSSVRWRAAGPGGQALVCVT